MSADAESATPVAELAYADAIDELERIVQELDDGVIDIDTLSDQFQRAIDIVEELDARILRTKEQVARLTPRLEALAGTPKDEQEG
jgi:exodeoxyribonuclease VII small subunit